MSTLSVKLNDPGSAQTLRGPARPTKEVRLARGYLYEMRNPLRVRAGARGAQELRCMLTSGPGATVQAAPSTPSQGVSSQVARGESRESGCGDAEMGRAQRRLFARPIAACVGEPGSQGEKTSVIPGLGRAQPEASQRASFRMAASEPRQGARKGTPSQGAASRRSRCRLHRRRLAGTLSRACRLLLLLWSEERVLRARTRCPVVAWGRPHEVQHCSSLRTLQSSEVDAHGGRVS